MSNTTTTTTRKPTKREMFEGLKRNYNLTADEVAFIDHELDLLARKNLTKNGERKLTEVQKQNVILKDEILAGMEEGVKYTISDLIKSIPACAELSTPKVSAVMRQLKDDDLVIRTEDKRKAYFELA